MTIFSLNVANNNFSYLSHLFNRLENNFKTGENLSFLVIKGYILQVKLQCLVGKKVILAFLGTLLNLSHIVLK